MMIPDVEPGRTGRDHRRSLGTDWRQGSKIFLMAAIESEVETGQPESVLGSMLELAEIEFFISKIFHSVRTDTGDEVINPR